MVNVKKAGVSVGVMLPSLILMLVSVDAALMLGQDVFLFSFLQVVVLSVFLYRG